MMAAMAYEIVTDFACVWGEGPLWHAQERRLYWTDISAGRLYWYDPAAHRHERCYEGRPVGGFTIQADGALLLFRDRGNVVIWRGGRVVDTIVDEIPDEVDTRFNDVFADPVGRVYCGTMPAKDHPARLYRLDPDCSLALLLDGIGLSNGMGLTPDGKGLYFTDSDTRHIYRFDYDRATGELSNQRLFVETPEDEGVPDGMTVDATGDVWSARCGGSGVFRYGPDGQLKQKIELPAKSITCVTFAPAPGSGPGQGDGEVYNDLYISSGGGDDKSTHSEAAGALFRVRPGVSGRGEHLSRVGV